MSNSTNFGSLQSQPIGGSANLKNLMAAKLGTPISENANRRALGELSNSVFKKTLISGSGRNGVDGGQKLEKIPDVGEQEKVVDDQFKYLPPEISRDALQPVPEIVEHEDDDDLPEPEMMALQPSADMLDYYSSIEPPEDIQYHHYEEEDSFRSLFKFEVCFPDPMLDSIDETLSALELSADSDYCGVADITPTNTSS